MTRHMVITLTLLASTALMAWASDRAEKWVLNYHRLSTREIGITCANGGDPTGTKVGDVLIISCGKD